MSSFQRMVVIPQEEYAQLNNLQNVHRPLMRQFYDLDRQYNENANISDPYQRLVYQSDNLEDMKRLKDQMRNNIQISTPKPYRNRAQALLQTVEPHVKYNERGEIYDEQGNVIEKSRLEDLIQHAVRDRRRNLTPLGWETFRKILERENIPKSILNRNTLDEIDESASAKPEIKNEAPTQRRRGRAPGRGTSKVKKEVKRLSPKRKSPAAKRQSRPTQRYPDTQFLRKF